MNIIRWGIIGCGDVCEVKSGPAFYKTEHSELIAVMRRDAEKAKDFAQRHHVKKWYTDAQSLINDSDVDIVYIATPPNTHKQYAIDVMKAGKPVYVEKPMALNYDECIEMLRVSQETGQKLFTAFYRRALHYFLKIKELINSNAIGDILSVDIRQYCAPKISDFNPDTHTWRVKKEIAGEGYFFDLAPHALDMLDFLLGEIENVKSFAANRGGLYDVKDTISAVLQFKSGVQGNIQYCFVSPKAAETEYAQITGTRGCIRFGIFSFAPIQLITDKGSESFTFPRPEHIQQPLIEAIVNELRGIEKCPSTAENGIRTAQILDMLVNV